jgi:hypothetical protein
LTQSCQNLLERSSSSHYLWYQSCSIRAKLAAP